MAGFSYKSKRSNTIAMKKNIVILIAGFVILVLGIILSLIWGYGKENTQQESNQAGNQEMLEDFPFDTDDNLNKALQDLDALGE